MIANRELGMDDYLAICRRRLSVVLIPALIAPLIGFLISFALTPKYTSSSLLLVESQVVPAGYVKPIITQRVSDRMTTLQEQVLSRNRLQPLVNRLGLIKKGKTEDQVIDDIRNNISVSEADPSAPPPGSPSSSSSSNSNSKRRKLNPTDDVPGFVVSYTADNPRDAQQVCAEVTSMLLEENLELREQVARSTTDFLSRQLEQTKRTLEEADGKLAAFKKQHFGQLPGDAENNLKLLISLNSQLDANTQTLSRAQQDESYAESLLVQEISAWKSSQASPNVPTLHDQLVAKQNELVILQGRYTDRHPDVVKVKTDIEELKARLKEMNASTGETVAPENASAKIEPPEILRLRSQIHQQDDLIARATAEQTRLQEQIDSYQGRISLSPDVEEQYKQLTRDNDAAQKLYDSLLTNKSDAEMQTEMERRQEGEQMRLLNPASLPDSASFPVRWMFAAGGLGAGLAIGFGIALWLELRDKSIRNEGDVMAGLELPMLVSLPWVGEDPGSGQGKNKFRDRFRPWLGSKGTAEA